MAAKIPTKDLLLVITIVIMLALLPVACSEGFARQAEADYQECLSWQAQGYDVRCDKEQYR